MNKNDIISILNNRLIAEGTDYFLDSNTMDILALDVSRVIDRKITEAINIMKKTLNIKVNSTEKEVIRKFFIGYDIKLDIEASAYRPNIQESDISRAYELLAEGFRRNENIMVDSIIARVKKHYMNDSNNTVDIYIKYINELQKNNNQLFILDIDADKNYSSDNIAEIIEENYNSISNYHYGILIFRDGIKATSWKHISEIALFMEGFKKEHSYNIYEKRNKVHRISEFNDFLSTNKHINFTADTVSEVKDFYSKVLYGFQFEDLFITDDGKTKILIMQKVELDESPKKCPVCMQEKVRGNSYTKVLYKSFECQNPSCTSRSKLGRGKRFDLFSAKRQIMLERNSHFDYISKEIYIKYRRDIITNSENLIENLILLYSWDGDTVSVVNSKINLRELCGRTINTQCFTSFSNQSRIKELGIFKLFTSITKSIKFTKDFQINNQVRKKTFALYSGHSTDIICNLDTSVNIQNLGGAVTSPPYYNAREYAQWPNLLCYLVDMMLNAKAVFDNLRENSTYIYNIGDIVGQDNVYIKSNMSKRRQMLGFYSIFIFDLVGYKTLGNIIWDKGEVQSKRNSTANYLSGYIKPINAYEHCFIFSKTQENKIIFTEVQRIETVKKINSKGINVLGHTAPYPIGIAKMILPYVNNDDVVVDPFLGSGTSVLAMLEENMYSIGFEINNEYYNLAKDRILDKEYNLSSLSK